MAFAFQFQEIAYFTVVAVPHARSDDDMLFPCVSTDSECDEYHPGDGFDFIL